jgi:hypothetical protein
MATEKRHFPTPKEMKRRQLYSDLLTAIPHVGSHFAGMKDVG